MQTRIFLSPLLGSRSIKTDQSVAMLFNSYPFILVFLPVTVAGYLVLCRRWPQVTVYWLVAVSLVFYAGWNPDYVPLLLGSATFNYLAGRLIARARAARRGGGALLAGSVAANLALLGYFKYANFFIATVGSAAGFDWTFGKIILPLGISFFTFTQLAFLVDVWRGEASESSFPKYLLFVTFFPHLIAGPILHHKEVMPQFGRPSENWTENLSVGLTIFVLGLFKKVVIADGIAPFVAPVFDAAANGQLVGPIETWCAALAFGLQLYFDFSGYSDMAIGLARMVGITFPLNFASPYKAPNIIEFWRHWHMTLSRFLRDYLYIPLGGNRRGKLRRYVNLMVTMALGGLWHGAGWTFIIWGVLHGVFLVINHLWRAFVGSPGEQSSGAVRRAASCGVTFIAVTVAWVFFRAPTAAAAFHMLSGMAGLKGFLLPIEWQHKLPAFAAFLAKHGVVFIYLGNRFTGIRELEQLALLLTVVWLMPNTQEIMSQFAPALAFHSKEQRRFYQWRPSAVWAFAVAILAIIPLLQLNRVSEFLYYQF
jgi:alginate O-acetyltransferase complex protein AlgI